MVGFFAVGLAGCKKDKLVGEYEILEGSWSLAYIVEVTHGQISATTYDTLFPASINHTYRLEFLSEGILKQYTDGELVDKHRIVFDVFGPASSTEYDFIASIKLDNNPEGKFLAEVSETKMSTSIGHISDDYLNHASGNYEIVYEFIYLKD